MRTSIISKFLTALFLLAMLLICFSCDIMKSSQKSKTSSEEENNTVASSNTASALDYKTSSWQLEPIDTSRPFTYQGKTYDNVKVVVVKSEGKQQENKTENKTENSKISADTVDKTKDKKENFDSTFILYIVGGVVALGTILGITFLFFLFRAINNNSKAIEMMAKK